MHSTVTMNINTRLWFFTGSVLSREDVTRFGRMRRWQFESEQMSEWFSSEWFSKSGFQWGFERVCRRQQLSNITLSTWSIRSHLVASKRDDQLARRSQNVCYVWACFVIIKLFFLIITKCVWMKDITFMELCKTLLDQKSNAKLLEEHVTKVQTNQTSSLSESLQIGTFCLLFLRPFLGVFWKYIL